MHSAVVGDVWVAGTMNAIVSLACSLGQAFMLTVEEIPQLQEGLMFGPRIQIMSYCPNELEPFVVNTHRGISRGPLLPLNMAAPLLPRNETVFVNNFINIS
jgi:hypothetical protein